MHMAGQEFGRNIKQEDSVAAPFSVGEAKIEDGPVLDYETKVFFPFTFSLRYARRILPICLPVMRTFPCSSFALRIDTARIPLIAHISFLR